MPISITAIYASILALIILALSINVTMHRVKLKVSLGDGGNPQMLRMIRLHANAIEYIPIALVLMAIYEINGGWHWALHVIGIALVAGRLIQTAGMWTTDVAGNGRRIGQSLTWLSLAALALLNLAKVL
ncbi:MAG: MAPEG family protein [Hyphomicrobiales bacterium]